MRIESAENWYEVRTLDDGVTHIEEPHIVPFYRCNIWLVHGRERRRRREAAVRRQARNLADELGNEDYHEAFVRDGTRRC